jgi:hypothetical protein
MAKDKETKNNEETEINVTRNIMCSYVCIAIMDHDGSGRNRIDR